MAIKKITVDYTILGELNLMTANLSYQENLNVDSTSSEVVASVKKSSYDGVFFDYVVKNGVNVRAGTVIAVHDGTEVTFLDNSTTDLGDTSGVTLTVAISEDELRLNASVSTDNWVVKTIIRAI